MAGDVAGITHDITFEDTVGTNKTGFMLSRTTKEAPGRRPWSIRDTETIAPRILTAGAMERSEFPPAIQLPIVEHRWRRGIGQTREIRTGMDDVHGLATADAILGTVDGILRLAGKVQTTTTDNTPTADRPAGFAVVGTEFWAFIGRDVWSWNFTTKQWIKGTVPQALDVVYKNGVAFATETFVPGWEFDHDPATLIYKADADADWTLQTGAGAEPIGGKYIAKARNASNVDILYLAYIKRTDGTFGNNIIVSSATPKTASSYSSETAIGQSDSAITNILVGDDNHVIVFKTNGVWTVETDGTVINRTPNFELAPRSDNFTVAYNWNGRILTTVGPSSLMELRLTGDSTRYIRRDVSLRWYMPEQTKYHNRIAAIFGDDTRLFVLVQDTSSYYLLQAELLTIDGLTDYRWHHVATITPTTMGSNDEESLYVDGLTASSVTHHRLWIATEDADSGTRLNPQFYPLTDNDADYARATSGTATTHDLYAGLELVPKRLEGIDLDLRGTIDATHTIKLEYQLDGGSWVTWGIVNEDVIARAFPPGLAAKYFNLRFTFASDDNNSPEINSFRVRTQLQPDPSQIITLQLYIADGQLTLNGTRQTQTSAALAQLRTWNAQAESIILRRPDFGLRRAVLFLPGSYREHEIHFERRRRAEYLVEFALLLTGANINTALWDVPIWNQFTWG